MKNFIALIICTILVLLLLFSYATGVNSNLSQNIVRLHVIANSDSDEDQALKLKVRDAILDHAKSDFTKKEDVQNSLDTYREIAQKVIDDNGYNYTAEAEYGNFHFPTKHYENISLPAGSYDAVRIRIGKAEGKNWWCIMFPPLCFVDGTTSTAYAEEKLFKSVSKESYDIITSEKNGKFPFEIKFKIIEFCGNFGKHDKVYASTRKD